MALEKNSGLAGISLSRYSSQLLKLQNMIDSPIRVNDAVVDIIEVMFENPGSAVKCPTHTHTWYEMNYITKNRMWTGIEGETFAISAGEYFLIPPGVEHSHRYNSQEPHEGFVLRWQLRYEGFESTNSGSDFYSLLSSLKGHKPCANKDTAGLGKLMLDILEETDHAPSAVSLQLMLVRWLSLLAGHIGTKKADMVINTGISSKNLVRKVDVLINDDTDNRIDVHLIASSLHMSYGHLARVYKKETGRTLVDRLNEIRLEKSLELLVQSDYSIKEISFKAGFSSQFYFSRIFKNKYGLTPGEYKKLGKKA